MPASQRELVSEAEVGNYFVSAYPPFSCWHDGEVGPAQLALETPAYSSSSTPLGFYAHVPFCVYRCQFCYYRSFSGKSREVMDQYVDALLAELALYCGKPAVAGRRLNFAYFGGGTPSLLSVEQIQRLLQGTQGCFPWTDVDEVTFECAPKTTTQRRLRMLRQLGVTRISLGVQQLNDQILQQNGRVHLVRDVERAYEEIQRVGFDTVNIDLIVGLVGESEETFFDSLERVIEMRPDSVTIYPLEIPANTPLYRELVSGNAIAEPADWETKRDRLARAFVRLEQAGYAIQTGYAAVRDTERNRFVYQDSQYHGADLIGAGVASFSYVAGVHYQNTASLDEYQSRIAEKELPVARSYSLSDEEQLVREFVLQLKLGHVDAEYFRAKFDAEVAEIFAAPLEQLSSSGWLTVTAQGVTLTRDGLLRADRLLSAFYLPHHQNRSYW